MEKNKENNPFTLTELLVTIAIIVFLMGIVISTYTMVMRISAEGKVKSFIKRFEIAAEMYREEFGFYPLPQTNWGNYFYVDEYFAKRLQPTPSEIDRAFTTSGTIGRLKDPWNKPYIYSIPGVWYNKAKFDFYSSGSDLSAGTSDDIGNFTN